MTPSENERNAIQSLTCPLCKNKVGWDFEHNHDQPNMLFLYCKNDETCGIEIRKLQTFGWSATISYWRNLK